MNISSLPNPDKNTIVEITQDGRHALYLTDEQLAIAVAVFANMWNSGKFRLSYDDYNQILSYLEEHKIADNDTLYSVASVKVAEVAEVLEQAVFTYKNS